MQVICVAKGVCIASESLGGGTVFIVAFKFCGVV